MKEINLKVTTINSFRIQILDRLNALEQEDTETASARAPVTLDQQSVGRLSRMDALQQQAMANATHQRRQQEKSRLRAALDRIAEGEFGYCLECGDEVDQERLNLDPSLTRCFSCATQG